MGLDWVLHEYRPKKGKQRAFAKAWEKLGALREAEAPDDELAAARAAVALVAHTPMEDIGAPRVGIDARATRWFLENSFADEVARAKATGTAPRSKEEALAEAHGQFVLALAKDKRGFAGGSFLVSSLDYGARIIDACTDVVKEPSAAWIDRSAKEAAAYARELRRDLAAAQSPTKLRDRRRRARAKAQGAVGPRIAASGTHDDRPWVEVSSRGHALAFEDQVRAVKATVAWLEYWSKRGYGYRAWF